MTALNPLRITALAAMVAVSLYQPWTRAADHGDGPALAHDQAADLADVYFFLDPADNTKAIIIGTFHGFIVPGEASNFAIFDPNVRYHFDFYDHVNLPAAEVNPKKIKPSKSIDVTFSPRLGGPDPAAVSGKEALEIPFKQTATVQLSGFEGIDKKTKFTADCLNPSLAETPPSQAEVVKEISPGIKFFAGEVDDPFFFDIPGFSGLISSIRTTGTPDTSKLSRGRDTFAGYNALSIAFSVPVAALKGTGSKIGVVLTAQRHQVEQPQKDGTVKGIGAFKGVDRMGNPAVNVVLIPFSLKNAYNAATPKDDAAKRFVGDIAATITALGLGTNEASVGLLVNTAVTYGDLLTLNTTVPNTGNGGGDVAGAGFPNGRRLRDDVVDTLISVLTNGGVTTGDSVNANDVAFGNTFPFLAPTQQPRPAGTVDDNTRN